MYSLLHLFFCWYFQFSNKNLKKKIFFCWIPVKINDLVFTYILIIWWKFEISRSDTGIVNVYSGNDCRNSTNPRPLFNVSNLVTAVSSIAFNSDAQLMAICSNVKDNHLRLVHVASQTTFKNFPERNGKVTHARCVEFSPNGGYMAVGNDDGRLHVFEIHHFTDY